MIAELGKAKALKGEVTPPPDKSISHRAVMFSALAEGRSVVRNCLMSEDTLSTINAFRAMGIQIEESGEELVVNGLGLDGLKEPSDVLDCGNSGTTMRLLSGVLSGQSFLSVLNGDDSLRRRPMGRVIKPLAQMGASIMGREGDEFPPVAIRGGNLKGIKYEMPVASAQLKSALLLAGLYADGTTTVVEPYKSRDHTERMLPAYGAEVSANGLEASIVGKKNLSAADFTVPGDYSSGAFFICASLLVEGSEILVRDVGINPLRTGLSQVLRLMGADIEEENVREVSGEPVADIRCRTSRLKSVEIGSDMIPSCIDEFPVLCVAAAMAEGTSVIRGAEELRVKESDRIGTVAQGLRAMGVEVEEFSDGLAIKGTGVLKGAEIQSIGDHRVAMAFSVAALVAEGKTSVYGAEAVNISFPGFYEMLGRLTG